MIVCAEQKFCDRQHYLRKLEERAGDFNFSNYFEISKCFEVHVRNVLPNISLARLQIQL